MSSFELCSRSLPKGPTWTPSKTFPSFPTVCDGTRGANGSSHGVIRKGTVPFSSPFLSPCAPLWRSAPCLRYDRPGSILKPPPGSAYGHDKSLAILPYREYRQAHDGQGPTVFFFGDGVSGTSRPPFPSDPTSLIPASCQTCPQRNTPTSSLSK